MTYRLLLSAAAITLVISQVFPELKGELVADQISGTEKVATDLHLNTRSNTQDASSDDQLPGLEDSSTMLLGRHLWEEVESFRETGSTDAHHFVGDAWTAGSDLMIARYLWQEADQSFMEEEDKDVHPFIGDAWMAESDGMLARYLWREGEGFRETLDTDVHTFLGDAWMAESDLMLARYLWRETETISEDLDTDVRTFLGDAWMARSDLMLARYLWRESGSLGETQNKDVHTFLGDAWMAESNLMLARYLWEEEPSAEAEVHLARYLWQEAGDNGFVEREDMDVHTFVGDAWMASPDLMLARHLWDEEPRVEQPTEGRVARHLWEEQPADNSADVQLARHLWQEEPASDNAAMLMSRHLWEEQPADQAAKAQLARHLWEEQPADQAAKALLARHLWEEQPTDDNAELLMARYLWQEGASQVSIDTEPSAETQNYIVTGPDFDSMMVHLNVLGATTHSILPLINAAEVELTDEQLNRLSRDKIAGLMPNHTVQTASIRERATGQHLVRETEFTKLIEADVLHREGVRGQGVGVAVVDTGMWDEEALSRDSAHQSRVVAYYDATQDSEEVAMTDDSGHGSHISSVIASSLPSYNDGKLTGSYHGIAPDADLVIVKAFGADGSGTYIDVIRAISYVIEHKDEHNIRVLNLSFSGSPQSHYWEDPINVAVMEAWRAGIVVVASAGNTGPDPLTIGVPGNVPYIVTVGAMTDSYTPGDASDDVITSFSAAGPTYEGHVKPDLVAPGGHMMGIMSRHSDLASEYPQFHNGGKFFEMSGTSQASAVAAGVAALMIQMNPELSPDDVKCRLMSSARAAVDGDGELSFSLFQQGAGLVNALDAILSEDSDCVNQGLDIDADLDGSAHFGGSANQDENGNFYVGGLEGAGSIWRTGHIWNSASIWRSGHIWNSASIWRSGHIWNSGSIWRSSHIWDEGAKDNQRTYSASFKENGYNWSVESLGYAGHIWNSANVSQSGHIWNSSVISSKAFSSTNGWVDQE